MGTFESKQLRIPDLKCMLDSIVKRHSQQMSGMYGHACILLLKKASQDAPHEVGWEISKNVPFS